jgi:hypothetical protein
MASDLLVIMGASDLNHGTLPLYREQLAKAGIETLIVDVSDRPNLNGGGNLGYRVDVFRRWAAAHLESHRFLIFSDAFDVTCYASSVEEIISRIPTTHLLHAAEKNCYPDPSIASRIDGDSLWKFANGGLVAGTPAKFIEWCDSVVQYPFYNPAMLDQEFLNIMVANKMRHGIIDDRTNLFFCLYGGYGELDFVAGKPINMRYRTTPLFLHANGQWDTTEMFEKYKRSLL